MASAMDEKDTVASISLGNIQFEDTIPDNATPPEFTNVPLGEGGKKKNKVPRKILHFSDGTLEEYSTDEEEDEEAMPPVDPKSLNWLPWFWYYIVNVAFGTLSVADSCGEKLAWFFGITSPKYQYAIDEYYRMKDEETEEKKMKEREEEAERSREAKEFEQVEEGEDRAGPYPLAPLPGDGPIAQSGPDTSSIAQQKPADIVSEVEAKF